MVNWIITDFGQVLKSGTTELTKSLGYTQGGTAIESYAVENMGHVALAERGDKIHVRFRPVMITDKAVSEMLYWLLDRHRAHVTVSWFDDIWHLEQPMPCGVAITFICHLMDKRTAATIRPAPRLLAKKSEKAERCWQETAAEIVPLFGPTGDEWGRRRALDHHYRGRWTVVDVDVETGHAVGAALGDGYPPLEFGPRSSVKQFNFGAFGDGDYKRWVLDNFIEVANSNAPRFDDVDAIVQWSRTGDMRTRYWRIAAPLHRRGNLCRLLSISGGDSSIDLRPNHLQISA
jgi:hypothetical protein